MFIEKYCFNKIIAVFNLINLWCDICHKMEKQSWKIYLLFDHYSYFYPHGFTENLKICKKNTFVLNIIIAKNILRNLQFQKLDFFIKKWAIKYNTKDWGIGKKNETFETVCAKLR